MMNDTEFSAVMALVMCSDPWPDGVDRKVIERLLDHESTKRGYTDWIDAYHGLK